MITILTLAIGHDYCQGLKECLDLKKLYALNHGYNYIQGGEEHWDRSRPIAWSKIPFILSVLSVLEEGVIVWLSDADVLITNSSLTIEDHILPHFPNNKDMLMCIDACGHINSGNIFFRNTACARDFWKRVGEQTDLLYHIWWENVGIIKLLETVPDDLAHVEITSDHTRFNSYIQGLPGQPLWKPGHFLVHFAGIYNILTIRNYCEQINKINFQARIN
jgi:hypothetical protein